MEGEILKEVAMFLEASKTLKNPLPCINSFQFLFPCLKSLPSATPCTSKIFILPSLKQPHRSR